MGDFAVRRLTPAERGVWIDLLALAAIGKPTGYVCDAYGKPISLDEIARITNAGSVAEVAELINGILEKGAASRDRSGRLFNRRMVRDVEREAKKAALSEKRAQIGSAGGRSTALRLKAFQNLPQQVPQLLPEQVPKQTLVSPTQTKLTSLTTIVVGEREKLPTEEQKAACAWATREEMERLFAKKREPKPPDELEIPGFLDRRGELVKPP